MERLKPVSCKKFDSGVFQVKPDLVVTEEPLEIRLGYGGPEDRIQRNISVTMRTPGNDFELVIGFLFTEGILKSWADVLSVKYCTDAGRSAEYQNIVRVELKPGVEIDLKNAERNFYTTSACGICGKTSIEAVKAECETLSGSFSIPGSLLIDFPFKLRAAQALFEHTGGLHAAGLFNPDGELVLLREDVGRHNATDKIVGAALMNGMHPLEQHILLLSGRISFELVQKAAMARIPIIAAIGAPSSLAIELAEKLKITLCGFLRDNRFNVYSNSTSIT